MQKKVILAKIRCTMDFSDETKLWLCNIEKNDPNLRNEFNRDFFGSNPEIWTSIFIHSSENIINEFFLELGLLKEDLPKIEVLDSYSGSLVIDASVFMYAADVVTLYYLLRGISEIPKICDGLVELKNRLNNAIRNEASKTTSNELSSIINQNPPSNPVITNVNIDTRPLLGLDPSKMRYHKVNMNVGVARHSLTLENLGNETLKNVRIGLFSSIPMNNSYDFEETYKHFIDILSSHQTIRIPLSDFKDNKGNSINLSHAPVDIVCWIEDDNGTYIFTFHLD